MTFVNNGGNDLKDSYEILQSMFLPKTGQREFLMEIQHQLVNEFSFQIGAYISDINFTTLAGDPLPDDYVANGGTICNFDYTPQKEGYLYMFKWENHWYKVGYSKDSLQYGIDGWWDRCHPSELCKKLDSRYCELEGVWGANRNDEENLHIHFHGKAKRGEPREFYRKDEIEEVKEYINKKFKAMRKPEGTRKKRTINLPRLNCEGCGFGGPPKCNICGKEIKSGKIERHIQQVHKKIRTV